MCTVFDLCACEQQTHAIFAIRTLKRFAFVESVRWLLWKYTELFQQLKQSTVSNFIKCVICVEDLSALFNLFTVVLLDIDSFMCMWLLNGNTVELL